MNTTVWRCVVCGAVPFVLGGCAARADGWTRDEQTGSTAQDLNSAKWQGWNQIPNGTGFDYAPAVTTGGNNLDLFIVGKDGGVWLNFWSSLTGWLGYNSIGGAATSGPSATRWGAGANLAVAVKGTDNFFWINVAQGPGHPSFGGWKKIPGQTFEGSPALTLLPVDNVLYLFGKLGHTIYVARNDVHTGVYDQSGWSAWQDVPGGGQLESAPAAVALGRFSIELVAQGLDGNFWINETTALTWTGWSQVPGLSFQTGAQPAVSSWGTNHIDVFGLSGTKIKVNSRDGSTWSGYSLVPNGDLDSPAAAVSLSVGSVDVIARGFDEAFWSDHYQQ
jgi:hypothetical protein